MGLGLKFFDAVLGGMARGAGDVAMAATEIGDAAIGGSKILGGGLYHSVTKPIPKGEAYDIAEAVLGRKLKKSVALVGLPVVAGTGMMIGFQNVENREKVGTVTGASSTMNRVYGKKTGKVTPELQESLASTPGLKGNEADLVFALHNMR